MQEMHKDLMKHVSHDMGFRKSFQFTEYLARLAEIRQKYP